MSKLLVIKVDSCDDCQHKYTKFNIDDVDDIADATVIGKFCEISGKELFNLDEIPNHCPLKDVS